MTEKKENKTEHEPVKSLVSKIKGNYWMVASIVLAILLLGILISNSMGKVSANQAGKILTNFAESQGVTLNVVSISSNGSFYAVTAEIQGQTGVFYVSKDGKYFTSALVPITSSNSNSNTNTNSQQTPTEVPKSDKPVVELFIMTYCPFGTQMQKAILPVATALGSKIDFKVKWVSYLMHGQKEADENVVQYCIQKEQNSKYLNYIQCFLGSGNSNACLKNASINTAMLNSCAKSTDTQYKINETIKTSTSQYPKFAIDADANTKYGVRGSPTLIINGVEVQAGRSPAAVLSAVCGAFTKAPSECSLQLPSAQASPGFGYGTSAADTNAAQCG
jgi:protein-disulfide isomerase